eukprot:m.76197 g.76197  ORF g.76197 m.76197 type:complete len:248 (-) comp12546_c0_seq5:55-798(-)
MAGFGNASETTANYWYSDRVCQIVEIFKGVFGNQAETRLYPVMGTWTNVGPTGYFPVTKNVLTWHDNYKCVKAVAVTGYYGVGADSSGKKYDLCYLSNLTLSEFFALWNNESNWDTWLQTHLEQQQYIANFSLDMVAYESGLGLAGTPSAPCQQEFAAYIPRVLQDPRTQAVAYKNIQQFASLNATLMNIFSLTSWSYQIFGDWGQLNYMDSAGTEFGYKWAGILQYLDDHKTVTTRRDKMRHQQFH